MSPEFLGLNVDSHEWFLDESERVTGLTLFQVGNRFVMTDNAHEMQVRPGAFERGSRVATLGTRRHYLAVTPGSVEKQTVISLEGKLSIDIPLPEHGPLHISTDMNGIVLDTIHKPDWAESMGRDKQGLFVTLPGETFRIYWPEWASDDDVGADEHGVYAAFRIEGVPIACGLSDR